MTEYNDKIAKSINSLLKIAQDVTDMVAPDETAAPEQTKASPEDVLEALSAIVSELEGIMNALPVQNEPTQPTDQEAPVDDGKMAKLEDEVNTLREKLAKKDREEIASKIADFYPESERIAKFKEISESKDEIQVLQAKLDAISEYSEKASVTTSKTAKGSSTFSHQKSAKLVKSDGKRLLTL